MISSNPSNKSSVNGAQRGFTGSVNAQGAEACNIPGSSSPNGSPNSSSRVCNSSVVKSNTLVQAPNKPICGGAYKLPVVLAEFVIQIDVESKIRLNEPAYEIKRIDKEVFLTECRYVAGTDKVFIEGYIRKNIEYASRRCTTESGIGGVINDSTVYAPFKCVTQVDFKGNFPDVYPNRQPDVARYYDKKALGKSLKEADRATYERFNEPVYPEIEWSEVYDADINDKGNPIGRFPNEEEFQEFTEKAVVYLGIKLLQKQQVGSGVDKKDLDSTGNFYPTPNWNGAMNSGKH